MLFSSEKSTSQCTNFSMHEILTTFSGASLMVVMETHAMLYIFLIKSGFCLKMHNYRGQGRPSTLVRVVIKRVRNAK